MCAKCRHDPCICAAIKQHRGLNPPVNPPVWKPPFGPPPPLPPLDKVAAQQHMAGHKPAVLPNRPAPIPPVNPPGRQGGQPPPLPPPLGPADLQKYMTNRRLAPKVPALPNPAAYIATPLGCHNDNCRKHLNFSVTDKLVAIKGEFAEIFNQGLVAAIVTALQKVLPGIVQLQQPQRKVEFTNYCDTCFKAYGASQAWSPTECDAIAKTVPGNPCTIHINTQNAAFVQPNLRWRVLTVLCHEMMHAMSYNSVGLQDCSLKDTSNVGVEDIQNEYISWDEVAADGYGYRTYKQLFSGRANRYYSTYPFATILDSLEPGEIKKTGRRFVELGAGGLFVPYSILDYLYKLQPQKDAADSNQIKILLIDFFSTFVARGFFGDSKTIVAIPLKYPGPNRPPAAVKKSLVIDEFLREWKSLKFLVNFKATPLGNWIAAEHAYSM